MNHTFAIVFVFYFVMINFSRAELTEIVYTTYGLVRGEILTTVSEKVKYSSFKGIPYAQPPVGIYRFQPPQLPIPWTDVLEVQKDPNPCPQLDSSKNVIGDEDCLYLNVYTPEVELSVSKELKPVMVWIHSGAFVGRSVNSSYFGPDFLMEKDVIVVAMNYRLGALGFLTLGNEEISGNAGLKDQALAIRWVNENIENFGGDPNKVTIFGQSSGSISVELHHLSPASQGSFRASIAMSGSPLNPWAMKNLEIASNISIEKIREKIMSSFNPNSTEDISKLYDVPFDEMVLLDDLNSFGTEELSLAFAPTIEVQGIQNQPFLTKEPLLLYQSGDFYQIPHILGYMNDEAISWRGISEDPSIKGNRTAIDEITFESFRVGIDLTRQLLIDNSPAPVFYYRNEFEYPEILHHIHGISMNGSGHGDDIAYIFYVQGAHQPLDPNDKVSIFRDKVVTLWTNFAKYLKPSATLEDGTELQWPPTNDAGLMLKLNSQFEIVENDA